MKFAEVIEGLNAGGMYQRYSKDEWNGKVIVKQVASAIPADVVPKMTSLPDFAKMYLGTVGTGGIDYHDQVLIISVQDGVKASATSYIPTWEDIFADDWRIV